MSTMPTTVETAAEPAEWVFIAEIAQDFGRQLSIVRQWFETGKVPGGKKVMGRWQVRRSDYLPWKREQLGEASQPKDGQAA